MHEVRTLSQQALPLTKRPAHQTDLAMFQVPQSTVNDSGGAAGCACGKIVLLDKQRATAAAGALARNGNAINATADDDDVKVLAFERPPRWSRKLHVVIRCRSAGQMLHPV